MDLDHRSRDPALVVDVIGLDPKPGTRVVATPHCASIASVHTPGIEISLAGSVAAVSLHQHGNGREGERGCGGDGRGESLGRR